MKYIDADRLREELENSIRCYYDFGISTPSEGGELNAYEDILAFLDFLQQEQPEVDLEKEIEKGWEELEKDYSPSALDKSYMIVSGLVGEKQFSRIARHFYELGLNARKEDKK